MRLTPQGVVAKELPDDHSECEPPDPISNSEVKVLSADGSVGSPHVRVGHCQASKRRKNPRTRKSPGIFFVLKNTNNRPDSAGLPLHTACLFTVTALCRGMIIAGQG